MAVDPLVQFPGPTRSATAVRQRKVVEHEQLSGSQLDLDFDVPDAEAVLGKERELGVQAVELCATEKVGVGFHAGKLW